MTNPVDIFDVMLSETIKSYGVNPKEFYTTCEKELRRKIWIKATDNLREMCHKFVTENLDKV